MNISTSIVRTLFDFVYLSDVWSAGCVLAELLLGQPIFPGDSGVDQLVEIIKVLGTPTREQIREMNPNYTEFKFPQIKAHPWSKVSIGWDYSTVVSTIFFCVQMRGCMFLDATTHLYKRSCPSVRRSVRP